MMISFTSQTSLVLLLLLFATKFSGIICSRNRTIRCNEKDKGVLLTFKQGVEDPFNDLSSWSTQQDCCSWAGVHCDNITHRVTKLDLSSDYPPNSFQGKINLLALLQLEFLSHLDLNGNNFKTIIIPTFQVFESLGSPPHQAANFSNLVYLDLSWNPSSMDNLHWLSRVPSLKYLNLSGIDLKSEINWLQSLGMLPSISDLRLSFCQLIINPSLSMPNYWLFNLSTDISYLDLSLNNLHGQIPMALPRLRNLKFLMLDHNQLNGSIPNWLGNISSLVELDLSNNLLSGNLPNSLGQLSNLKSLRVKGNIMAGVLTEMNFAKLSKLEILYLGSGLTFDVDSNWVPPFQLYAFDSGNTRLGPTIPKWLYTQTSLDFLYISGSGISSVDDDMFWSFLARILVVDLSNNSISGDISKVTLGSKSIFLDYNNFTGGLPHISPSVEELHASHNSFSGPISHVLCQTLSSFANNLSSLDISHNHLTGALPDCWENLKLLSFLYLGSNKLTGKIPPSMVMLSSLEVLDLQTNGFHGKFSLDLSNWTRLEYLILERNKFSGSLPNTMGQELVVMNLRANKFAGNIPPHICNLPNLMVLDIADNMLSGSIPQCIYNMTDMVKDRPELLMFAKETNIYTKGREFNYKGISFLWRSIDLSTNNLSGKIPKELFSLIKMWSLNLSRNHLTGEIPNEIRGMKNLESLDLSYNKLYGEIPQTVSNLSFLDYLNLSYNSFTGQIPLGTQLQSFDAWSYIGNPDLCGAPLPKNCTEEKSKKTNVAKGNEDDSFLKSLYMGMGVGFAMSFWGVCGSLFLIRAWRHTFFRLFDCLVAWLYVAVVLYFKHLR